MLIVKIMLLRNAKKWRGTQITLAHSANYPGGEEISKKGGGNFKKVGGGQKSLPSMNY